MNPNLNDTLNLSKLKRNKVLIDTRYLVNADP